MNLDFIIAYEEGALTAEEIAEGFQQMIDSGVVWRLQGHYGRMAYTLIELGHCTLPTES